MIILGGSGLELGGGSTVGSIREAVKDGRTLITLLGRSIEGGLDPLLGGSIKSGGIECVDDEGEGVEGGGRSVAEVGRSIDEGSGEDHRVGRACERKVIHCGAEEYIQCWAEAVD